MSQLVLDFFRQQYYDLLLSQKMKEMKEAFQYETKQTSHLY